MGSEKRHCFAVPKLADFIREQWRDEINDLDLFSAPSSSIRIELMDDSFVDFHFAHYLVSVKKRAILVVTEHCGCHVYPIHQSRIYQNGILKYQQIGGEF